MAAVIARAARLVCLTILACAAAVIALHSSQRQAARSTPAPTVSFQNIAAKAGVEFLHTNGATPEKRMVETMGSGGLFFDFNNDDWLDVFLVDGGSVSDPRVAARARHRLYRNRGNGTFEDVTSGSGISHAHYGLGACAADVDNDGWMDLYLTNAGPNVLYRNNGDGTFSDVTRAAGVGSPLLSTSCAFADVNKDGYVDLFVANYVDLTTERPCGDTRVRAYCRPDVYRGLPNLLYRNTGKGTFVDVSRETGIQAATGKSLGVVVGDYDDDTWPDIFVANDLTPNFLYRNTGNGAFTEVGLLSGVAVASDGKARAGMGIDLGDYNDDGTLDLVVANFMLETHNIFRNMGRGLFADATFESGIGLPSMPFVGFGALFVEIDNDADLDLAIANGHVLDNADYFNSNARHAQRKLLFRNAGHGKLQDISQTSGGGFVSAKVGRGLSAGDIDNDGDVDLLVTNNGQTADLLRNETSNAGGALLVRLIGRKSNRDGIGSRVRLVATGRTQVREVKAGSSYLGQSDLRVHFGLGQATTIDRLEIRWPAGGIETVRSVPVNHVVTIVEGQGMTRRQPMRSPS